MQNLDLVGRTGMGSELGRVKSQQDHADLAARVHELGAEIKLIGEAFYYFAWRARQALRAKDGLNLTFDPIGVRDVRNRLIEHSDRKDGVNGLLVDVQMSRGVGSTRRESRYGALSQCPRVYREAPPADRGSPRKSLIGGLAKTEDLPSTTRGLRRHP